MEAAADRGAHLRGGERGGVFFANGIGDHIMVLPTVRALASVLGKRGILFAMPRMTELFFGRLGLGRVVPVAMWKDSAGRNRIDSERIAGDSVHLQLFVSLNAWHSREVDVLLARLAPELSIGMHSRFDICVEPRPGEHSCDSAFRVAQALDRTLRIEDFCGPPILPEHFSRSATRILASVPRGQNILAVHNETLDQKTWRGDRVAQVVHAFLKRHADFVVIPVGDDDRGLRELAGHAQLLQTERLSLGTALAIVSQSDLFLGVDSCMLHMADLCRIPGVGLFGPAHTAPLGSREMGFRFGPRRHVSGDGNMDGIAPAEVLTALTEILPDAGAAPRRAQVVPRRQHGRVSISLD